MFSKLYTKFIITISIAILLFILFVSIVGLRNFTYITVSFVSILLSVQAIFTIIWMTYAWNDPESTNTITKPEKFRKPKTTFSIFIPALHEEAVIAGTIKSMSEIDYPQDYFEVFVINRSDDSGTISEVKKTISALKKKKIFNINHLIPNFRPKNKPDKLNFALSKAKNDVVVVFDAEDQVHPDILKTMNTHFLENDIDIIQGGVQLMNYRSTWFSGLNCLEYYYWFKSALHFFSKFGVTPLGGVTVFFKRDFLNKVNGWDAECLTEDADIGFRMSAQGAKIAVIYDSEISTRESTPLTVKDFVKQRTRWDLGFIQIIAKGQWKELDGLVKKLLALYVLFTPLSQSISIIFIPFMLMFGILMDLPVALSLLSYLPTILLIMIMITQVVIMYDFTRVYKLKFPFWFPIKMIVVFVPYILMLSVAALRGVMKYFTADFAWEKTPHNNTHRVEEEILVADPNISTELEN